MIAASASGAETAGPTGHDTAAVYGAREAIERAALSPDGTKVIYLAPRGDRGIALMIADAAGGSAPRMISFTDGVSLRLVGCDWSDNNRIVCAVRGESPAYGKIAGFRRTFAIDADGGRINMLAQKNIAAPVRISQFDGEVIDWMQGGTGKVLMARDHVPENEVGTRLANTEDGYAVDIVDTHTLASTAVERADSQATSYISDGKGVVRFKEVQVVKSAGMTDKEIWYYRTADSRDWHEFSRLKIVEDGPGLRPLSVDPIANAAYCLDKKDGRDALYRVSLDGSMKRELVLADPRFDIDDVVRLGRQARLIGATEAGEKRSATYFDPEYARLSAALSKALPGLPIVDFVSSSADETKLLLYAGGDTDPGRYYVFDKATHHLNELALVRPDLEKATLATMTPVSFPAADGTIIPAYLSLPPGGAKTGLPAIVLPHGGPASRDEWGFDWLVQFFTARGYAVLQPEFRGSTGYGDAWLMTNGFKNWRTAVGDVIDAGRWLIGKGIAAPDRLAIFGWSYGGYAALQSGVVAPGLFKAMVAVAPATDFASLRQEASGFTNFALVASYVGSGANADAGSPALHADAFAAPVLMFHGTADRNVSVEESRLMDSRLRKAGKQSTLVVYPELDHQLPDSSARADMLRRSDAFLRETLKLPAGG